ncbi:MAG: HEAT repeat domain-containing protein [Betaproteobacteria bacterium]|nr:HEAT repeat domain-containing protein [Betaproteobacteria bacterium]
MLGCATAFSVRRLISPLILLLALVSGSGRPQEHSAAADSLVLIPSGELVSPAVRGGQPVEAAPAGIELEMAETLRAVPKADASQGAPRKPEPVPLSVDSHKGFSEALVATLRIAAELNAAIIVLLLVYSIFARFARKRTRARELRFRSRWLPILYGRMAGDEVPLPSLNVADRLLFLMLLIETLGYVRDEAADSLVALAEELDMAPFVLRFLSSRSAWKRMVAIRAAGVLRLAGAVESLMPMAARDRGPPSLAAAAALIRIDAKRGLAALHALLVRTDWSADAVASMLKHSGAPTEPLLVGLLHSAPPQGVKRVVRLIEHLGNSHMLTHLRTTLAAATGPEAIAAILHALRAFGEAVDRRTAIAFLSHPDWIVRMQAAYALGGLGISEDAQLLASLLRDRNWWVRYRAAQSMLRLAGTGAASAAAEQESDPYARDMLRHVLAEHA